MPGHLERVKDAAYSSDRRDGRHSPRDGEVDYNRCGLIAAEAKGGNSAGKPHRRLLARLDDSQQ